MQISSRFVKSSSWVKDGKPEHQTGQELAQMH
jgi:hypothetical protein